MELNDNKLLKISKKVELISKTLPSNLKSQKQRFFKNRYKFNPQFLYNELDKSSLEWIEEEISRFRLSQIPKEYKYLYEEKLYRLSLQYNTIKALGKDDKKFSKNTEKLYGPVKTDYTSYAHKTLINAKKEGVLGISGQKLDMNLIKTRIEESMSEIGVEPNVILHDNPEIYNRIWVNKRFELNISQQYYADIDELNEVIGHEVYTHLVRLKNGSNLKSRIFKIGTANYEKDEEGLATLLGHQYKSNKYLYHPALLFIALVEALEGSFVDVFNKVNTILDDPERSWTYAYRVKRGLADTSCKGAFVKDLYFQWTLDVGRKILNNPDILNWAFDAKATLDELYKFKFDFSGKIVPKVEQDKVREIILLNTEI